MPLVHSLLTGRTHEQFGDRCPADIAIAYKLEIRGINNVLWKPHANKMVASIGFGFRSANNESTNQIFTTVHPNNDNITNLYPSFPYPPHCDLMIVVSGTFLSFPFYLVVLCLLF